MKIVGLDPSLTATGWAAYDTDTFEWQVGTIRSKPGAIYPGSDLPPISGAIYGRFMRARFMAESFWGILPKAFLVVIEAPAYNSRMGQAHDRSGLWWQYVDTTRRRGAHIVEVAPTTRAKYGTGKGNAGKDEVLAATIRAYPTAPVSNNNEADAVILAAIGARLVGDPADQKPTKAQLDALAKVRLDDSTLLALAERQPTAA